MLTRRDALWMAASIVPVCTRCGAAAPTTPADARLGPPKDLNGYFPFTPPKSKAEWAKRRQRLREQVMVSQGLWPLPEKTPLNPVVHGKIERDGYTVEKVFFASTPGHYVTGNLYRPTEQANGKRPGVLCPHGHWPNGRFHEAKPNEVKRDLALGAEATTEGATYPVQARMAALARLGFVVFHYDMIGYADSTAITHREGFKDAAAELRLQSFMGLQTWNSIRALDFLESLPDVDPKRLGVTGASGGGTQTFLLCAVDDRPAAAFPAVMVSTAMQGGCVCENCSYLRVGTGNVELAGLFAPKPMALSAANDWTKELMTKGFPELKALYKLLGAEENVAAEAWLKFPHNYSQPSREFMYSWFNQHLMGKPGKVAERPFVPVPPKELSVYDADHPRPKDELPADRLREKMTAASDAQMEKLLPKDAASLKEYQRVVGSALRAMLTDELPAKVAVRGSPAASKVGEYTLRRTVLGRDDEADAVPTAELAGPKCDGERVAVWLHPAGKASLLADGKPAAAAKALLDAGWAVVAPDVFGTGELTPKGPSPVSKPFYGHTFAGYTYGYNRPPLASQSHDALTAVAFARSVLQAKRVAVVGWGRLGPTAVLAAAAAGPAVDRTAADVDQFAFDAVTKIDDPMLLPGAVKYGGLGAFLALCAPAPVLAYNHAGTGLGKPAKAAYEAARALDRLTLEKGPLPPDKVVDWVTG